MAIAAKNIGTNSKVWVYSTTGTTDADTMEDSGDALGGITSLSWSVNNNMIDTTNNDDAGYTSAEYGNQSATLSVTCIYDPSDTAQTNLINAAFAKTKYCIGYHPIAANSELMYIFDALVEAQEVSGDNDARIEVSFTFTSDGTITKDAPTA